jgi:RNA polymerase sigma factor (sigma-70 family)
MQTNKRLLAGDNKSEEWDIEHYRSRVEQYCQFLTQNSWDGEDLFQETIIKAIRHYESSQINAALLKKIAYHHWVDTIRKRKHEVPGLPDDVAGNSITPTQSSIMETVELIMEKMTQKQAVVFILKEAFRFQSAEIAGILGMTEVAVKGALHRARKKAESEENHESGSILSKEERQLSSLLSESLLAQDPDILIDKIHEFPSFISSPKPAMSLHSPASLSFTMAA